MGSIVSKVDSIEEVQKLVQIDLNNELLIENLDKEDLLCLTTQRRDVLLAKSELAVQKSDVSKYYYSLYDRSKGLH